MTNEATPVRTEKLCFVNLGGYDSTDFGELDKNILLVTPDGKAATAKALKRIKTWALPLKYNILEVETTVDVTAIMSRYG